MSFNKCTKFESIINENQYIINFPFHSLAVVNASFSKFSVIASHSSVYVSFGSVDLVRIFFGFIFGNAELEVIHHKPQAVRSKWKKQKLESQVNVNNCFFIFPANYLLVCEMLKFPVFSYIASTVPICGGCSKPPGCKAS